MWIAKQFQRLNPCSSDLEVDDSIYPYACYACTQVGVPVFHSTTCDPDHQPEWEASAGSSLLPINYRKSRTGDNPSPPGLLPGRVLDPRSARVQRWNRIILLARAVALAVDPLFFFAMSIRVRGGGGAADNQPCIYMDGGVATIVSAIRTCVDLVHTCHFWLQFRLAYVSKESLVVGCGKLVWDPRAIASRYLMSPAGFWLDVFVMLPIPQAVYLLVVPKLLEADRIQLTLSILQIIFLMQFLPKVYHSFSLMRRMRKVTGYIFGTIWWGFGLNLIAYFLASHVSGGYWYILAIQRIASCLAQQCDRSKASCNQKLSCAMEVCYWASRRTCAVGNSTTTHKPLCLDDAGPFHYGLYKFALPLFSKNSVMSKILYSNLWGLMALSTMGNNLEPTCRCLEAIFTIFMVLGGLMLFTLLIANIQVFLHAIMVRRKEMQLRYRGIEWWMRHRQLPSNLKCRVRRYENQRWKLAGGQDEMEFIKDLPEGLRRDIKHYLCLGLIKKVPLLCNLDDLILDNICDRVKPLVYSKDEKIIREGDPVQRMIFIVDGRIRRSQSLGKGVVANSMLEAGSFLGDELLSWCLRRPVVDRLPASSATFTCIEPAEAYALDADDFRYITNHFRFHFANKNLKQTARYYSSNWRTWAAVNIQIAWRHYKTRARGSTNQLMLENGGNDSQRRLRHCAAFFMSLRPHDHLD
ncbi:cyclic nucleotide-gated ion channel 2-like [Coffea eugenioides]|uniref:cyclic nucleotide-gated ion channel 2-like n=1 Tax=Coffea eugenioides TaxID=49369 RepID=UPI000F5CACEC|nr:cyclic nucleotide-gated ion channel 2-like [Coffea arabica]XP_027154206.1 cyclic nucleotide-gated ion channel 2-like [Coffea eugenioides]